MYTSYFCCFVQSWTQLMANASLHTPKLWAILLLPVLRFPITPCFVDNLFLPDRRWKNLYNRPLIGQKHNTSSNPFLPYPKPKKKCFGYSNVLRKNVVYKVFACCSSSFKFSVVAIENDDDDSSETVKKRKKSIPRKNVVSVQVQTIVFRTKLHVMVVITIRIYKKSLKNIPCLCF